MDSGGQPAPASIDEHNVTHVADLLTHIAHVQLHRVLPNLHILTGIVENACRALPQQLAEAHFRPRSLLTTTMCEYAHRRERAIRREHSKAGVITGIINTSWQGKR